MKGRRERGEGGGEKGEGGGEKEEREEERKEEREVEREEKRKEENPLCHCHFIHLVSCSYHSCTRNAIRVHCCCYDDTMQRPAS